MESPSGRQFHRDVAGRSRSCDRVHDRQKEGRSALNAAAPLVGPQIGVCRKKLHWQIARRRVNLDAVEPGVLRPACTGDEIVDRRKDVRSEEHTSELQSLMRISYAVFCLKKKTTIQRSVIKKIHP